MANSEFDVLFQPDSLRVKVMRGTLLSQAMTDAGLSIHLPCGGTGKCGKCTVEIHPDPPEPTDFDRLHLSEDSLAQGNRLACKTKVDRSMSVLIKPGIRVSNGKILVDGIDRDFDLAPCVKKRYVELPEPSLEDQAADLLRVKRALDLPGTRCPEFDIDLARDLPDILRDSDFKVTVVQANDRVITIEPGDTSGRRYGMAFDIGTTTVVGTIIDLDNGSELAYASRLNGQVVYGEDTISRIQHAIDNVDGRREMADKVRGVINEIIIDAAEKGGIATHEIYEAVFAGNTTMSHLFLGLNPGGLSQIPFVPVTNAPVNLRARDVGVGIHPRGNVYVLPNIAGFVGADTVAVMLASNYLESGPIQLAVDVGTNGELALRHDDSLVVCSTAAGPALEGAALTCGMRAADGAIEHVTITDDSIDYDVIGDAAPIGLCGSGIIDLLAEMLESGIVDTMGRILTTEELEGNVSDNLLKRIITYNDEPAFIVVKGQDSEDTTDVIITQRDIRQIQLAKGAINSGIKLILQSSGLTPDDLHEILLAGAFGNYLRKSSARRIGLLPDIPLDRIRFIGNAASTGAKMALLSYGVREDADKIRNITKHLELAALPEFMNEYTDSMMFP
ncbi:ASKHA domain-containing protein [Candidatus Latescibacterota bacterium]